MDLSVLFAQEYVARSWRIVPISVGAKDPSENGREWQLKEWAPESCAGRNVGVILGAVSGGLTDIDLDCLEAIALAPYFLPPTLTFGHAPSKPASHWLYVCPEARNRKLAFGEKEDDGRKWGLIEVRATNVDGVSCGAQTVFPGSVWTSKDGTRTEPIEFDSEIGDPQEVALGDLTWALHQLALACVLLHGWTSGSGRREKSLAVSGALLKQGWRVEDVRHLLRAVRECAGDAEEDIALEANFAHQVETTIKAYLERGPNAVTGWGELRAQQLLSEIEIGDLERYCRTPEQARRDASVARTDTRAGERMRRQLREDWDCQGFEDVGRVIAPTVPASASASGSQAPVATGSTPRLLGRLTSIALDGLDEPPRPICAALGLFFGGKPHIDVGYAGTAKGILAMKRALCLASGKPFLGHDVVRTRVLYIDAETGRRRAKQRLHRLANGLGIDLAALEREGWFEFLILDPPFDAETLSQLHAYMSAREIGALHVDSLTSANLGLDQRDAEYANLVWALGELGDKLDCFVSLSGHAKKGEGTGLDVISGHNAIAAAVESAWLITRPEPGRPTQLEISCVRAVEDGFTPFRLEWVDVARGDDRKHALEGRLLTGEELTNQATTSRVGRERQEALAAQLDSANCREWVMKQITEAMGPVTRKRLRDRGEGRFGWRVITAVIDSLHEEGRIMGQPFKGTDQWVVNPSFNAIDETSRGLVRSRAAVGARHSGIPDENL